MASGGTIFTNCLAFDSSIVSDGKIFTDYFLLTEYSVGRQDIY